MATQDVPVGMLETLSSEDKQRTKVSRRLLVAGSVLLAYAFISYFVLMIQGKSNPNATTWVVNTLICFMHAVSYFLLLRDEQSQTQKGEKPNRFDLWLDISATVIMTVLTALITGYTYHFGYFSSQQAFNSVCVWLVAIMLICWVIARVFHRPIDQYMNRYRFWWEYGLDHCGVVNVLTQGLFFIAMLPTIIGLIPGYGQGHEPVSPWLCATIAYALNLCGLRKKPRTPIPAGQPKCKHHRLKYAYPIINGLMANGSVAVLAAYAWLSARGWIL